MCGHDAELVIGFDRVPHTASGTQPPSEGRDPQHPPRCFLGSCFVLPDDFGGVVGEGSRVMSTPLGESSLPSRVSPAAVGCFARARASGPSLSTTGPKVTLFVRCGPAPRELPLGEGAGLGLSGIGEGPSS